MPDVDALAGLLDGPRAQEAFLLRSLLNPPWSLRIQDEAPLTIVAVVRGGGWIISDGGSPVALHSGDIAIVRGPDPYVVADDPATPPQVVIHPGQRCETVDGDDLSEVMALGVRTWGNDPTGATVLLTGTYETATAVGQRLLSALPPLAVLPRGAWDSPLVSLLADEIVKDEPGQEAVLDRLLDLLVIAALRVWFSRSEAGAPGWYRAHSDAVVGKAVRLLHNNPERPWTLVELAAESGVSRATLARRFTQLVGEPPMSFLAGWRLTLAADLLREPDATVGAVAGKIGYGSPYALSTAFKRFHGISPREYRAKAQLSA
jgi:AraC-like DNA-binding protein